MRPMINLISLYLVAISFITFIICDNSSIPSEKSFELVESYSTKHISLDGGEKRTSCLLKFDNKWEDGDVIIQFAKGMSYSSNILIFKDYISIAKNEEGKYIGHAYNISMDFKEFALKGEEVKFKGMLYLIIEDLQGYYLKDFITVFNEMDAVKLIENSITTIHKFYSKKTRSFTITCSNEKINLSWKDFNINTKKIWTISKESQSESEITSDSYDYDVTLNIDKAYKGELTGVITFTPGENDSNELIHILYDTNDRIIHELKQDTVLEVPFIKSGEFSFFLSMETMEKYEESSITAYFQYPIHEQGILKAFNGRVINKPNSDDATLDQDIPKEQLASQFTYKQYKEYDTYFEMFFYNSEDKVKDKNQYLLLYIKLEFPAAFVPGLPLKFSLVAPKQPEVIDINTDLRIKLNDYVPIYYKINFPPCLTKSYLIYVSSPDIHTIYYNGLFNKDHSEVNNRIASNQLIGLPKSDPNCPRFAIIQIQGPSMQVNFTVESSQGDLVYSDKEQITSLNYEQIMDCSSPFYHISNYLSSSETIFYIEVISGQFDIYYKNEIKATDSNSNSIKLFPKEEDALKENYGIMKTQIDLLGLQCSIPGTVKINIISPNKNSITIGEQLVISILPDKISRIAIKNADQDFGLELSTTRSEEITFTINSQSYTLSKDAPAWRNTLPKETKELSFFSVHLAIINIKIGPSLSTTLVEKQNSDQPTINKDKHIYYKIRKNKEYSEFEFTVDNLSESGFKYELRRGAIPYITFPSMSDIPIIKPDSKKTAVVKGINPYELQSLDNSNQVNEEFDYYFAVSFEEHSETINNSIKINYIKKTPQDPVDENKLLLLSPNVKSGIKANADKTKKLLVIANKCGDKLNTLQLKYYNQILGKIALVNQVNTLYSPNYNLDMHFEALGDASSSKYDQLSYIYKFIDPKEEGDYNVFEDLKSTISYDNATKNLKWEMNKNLSQIYHVYVQQNNATSMDNDCYLQTLVPIQFNSEKNTTLSMLKKGDNYITVTAEITKPIQMRISMPSIKITFNPADEALLDYMIILYVVLGIVGLAGIIGAIIAIVRFRKKHFETLTSDNIYIQPLTDDIIN